MKLSDFQALSPIPHSVITAIPDGSMQTFTVGLRGVEDIEATPDGVVLTLRQGGELHRLLVNVPGAGKVAPWREATVQVLQAAALNAADGVPPAVTDLATGDLAQANAQFAHRQRDAEKQPKGKRK